MLPPADVPAAGNDDQSGRQDMPPETVREYLGVGQAWLDRHGSSSPRLDAEVLLAFVLGYDRLHLYLDFTRPLAPVERDRYRELLVARGRGKPVAYLVGEKEFYSLSFKVDPRVLIPRPDTETLLDWSLQTFPVPGNIRFVDVGTGSGCIAVSLAVQRPEATGFAIDISPPALELAQENAKRHQVDDRLSFIAGDLLAPLIGQADLPGFDLVISNPPYIAPDDPAIETGVREHEPAVALFSPAHGIVSLWHGLARQALQLLRPGGWLAVECGQGQAGELARMLAEDWDQVDRVADLSGVERVVVGRRPSSSPD